MASRGHDPPSERAGLESHRSANLVRLGLGLVGAAVVVVAIVLAVRSPSVSSKTATYNGPATPAAVPAKVVVTNARPSDTILAALLALGGVLLVAGAVYPRLSSLKGPGFEVGLAELSPDAREELAKKARERAEALGMPDEADAVAESAEKVLLDRFYVPIPSFAARSVTAPYTTHPYTTTYAVGRPLPAAPAVSAADIDEAISFALDEVAPGSHEGGS